MFAPPIMQRLAGNRLHLSHGPIDVVVKAWGTAAAVRAAYAAAWQRFSSILPELCDELGQLRRPMHEAPVVTGRVACRMAEACRPFRNVFVTPMAAVAGAVADELLAAMTTAAPLQRAFVNDGGDIAVLASEGHALNIGIAGEYSRGPLPVINGSAEIDAQCGVGGIATSGARGRSFSLGIADSVTTLARNAATADVAATLIANAVNVDSPAVLRRPARELDPDSDLGDHRVTYCVGELTTREIAEALARGAEQAAAYLRRGLVAAAALMLAGETHTLSSPRRPSRIALPSRKAGSRVRKHGINDGIGPCRIVNRPPHRKR
jgi:ApbE superfamily uncharacterized protein (UPF0280 family)